MLLSLDRHEALDALPLDSSLTQAIRYSVPLHRFVINRLPDFFFQAEDGIRDYKVTGVQTCAHPISTPARSGSSPTSPRGRTLRRSSSAATCSSPSPSSSPTWATGSGTWSRATSSARARSTGSRSEERRVGKGCRRRRAPYDEKGGGR